MNKLRIVQDRVEARAVEHDLRGLGADPIVSESFPVGALVIVGRNFHRMTHIAGNYGFDVYWSLSAGKAVVLPTKPRPGEHKLQAISLFLFFARISNDDSIHAAALIEINRFYFMLKNAIQKRKISSDYLVQMALEQSNHGLLGREAAYFSTDGAASLHLHQTGLLNHADAERGISLSKDKVAAIKALIVAEVIEQDRIIHERRALPC